MATQFSWLRLLAQNDMIPCLSHVDVRFVVYSMSSSLARPNFECCSHVSLYTKKYSVLLRLNFNVNMAAQEEHRALSPAAYNLIVPGCFVSPL